MQWNLSLKSMVNIKKRKSPGMDCAFRGAIVAIDSWRYPLGGKRQGFSSDLLAKPLVLRPQTPTYLIHEADVNRRSGSVYKTAFVT